MATLLLASQSPRRLALLQQVGFAVETIKVAVDETPAVDESVTSLVQRLSLQKAAAALEQERNSSRGIIIAADTVVTIDNQILGKPKDQADFMRMMELLSNNIHEVITGVCLLTTELRHQFASVTRVTMSTIDLKERVLYWQTGEPQDKAGGYAIQGHAAMYIRSIEGSYSGVVGLPLYETVQALSSHFQVSPWH